MHLLTHLRLMKNQIMTIRGSSKLRRWKKFKIAQDHEENKSDVILKVNFQSDER